MQAPNQPPAHNHYRMKLNNYLQRRFGSTKDLQLEQSSTGPQHALLWTVTALIHGVEYGRGVSSNIAAATELASEMALNALMEKGRGR